MLLLGEKKKLSVACIEVTDTCLCKGGLCKLRASPKKASVLRNAHATAVSSNKTVSQKYELACRKHAATLGVLWQEWCAPSQAKQVGGDPVVCPRKASGQSCGVDGDSWASVPDMGELCHQPPAWPLAASSHWTWRNFKLQWTFLVSCKKGGSKTLSSSRWIATHLVNQLINCNEYPALGKPSVRPHSPMNFPQCPRLTLLGSVPSSFCYSIYRINISAILSSSAVGSILRNNNQMQIIKQRPMHSWMLFYKPICNGQRRKHN